MCPIGYYTMVRSKDHVFDLRLRMVQHARKHSIRATARAFKCSRNTVRKWVRRRGAEGLRGLKDKSRAPHFCPHKTSPETEIVCGGGSGMALLKNILFSVCERWPNRKCWLFFGCRSAKDVFYLDEFRELEKKISNFHSINTTCLHLLHGCDTLGDDYPLLRLAHLLASLVAIPAARPVREPPHEPEPPDIAECATRLRVHR